ncbi:hypothetical protein BGZ63DRAFT_104972 [Mariannaea sp. PMI_226]|nr:hypothetical protein BGZ63DRAFT_104972 [Mariannaea sp. PMI_226]
MFLLFLFSCFISFTSLRPPFGSGIFCIPLVCQTFFSYFVSFLSSCQALTKTAYTNYQGSANNKTSSKEVEVPCPSISSRFGGWRGGLLLLLFSRLSYGPFPIRYSNPPFVRSPN